MNKKKLNKEDKRFFRSCLRILILQDDNPRLTKECLKYAEELLQEIKDEVSKS